MSSRVPLTTVAAAASLIGAGALLAPGPRAQAAGVMAGGGGPDLITSAVGWWVPADTGVKRWGTIDGRTAYSYSIFSCNIGTSNLPWNGFTAQHPTLAQNMYRLHDGRFEQIGAGPVKHVTATVPQDLFCGTCDWPGSFELGVGCSDPYDADRNGQQDRIGPRRDVDPSTGVTPYPFSTLGQTGDVLHKRVVVANADLDPFLNAGARYFIEGQYMSAADTSAGNEFNNSGYDEVAIAAQVDGGWDLVVNGTIVAEEPALYAWRTFDPEVRIEVVDVPGDGRFHVASRATVASPGVWRYEYAVLNYNSARGAGGFRVPLSAAVPSSIGFHDVDVDPIEGTDGTDWTSTPGTVDGDLAWTTEAFADNPDANAIRWSTLYNFRFTAERPPADGLVTIDLFAPGGVGSVAVGGVVPAAAATCFADVNDDGQVSFEDLISVMTVWGRCPGCPEDLDGNGLVGFADLFALLNAWGPC